MSVTLEKRGEDVDRTELRLTAEVVVGDYVSRIGKKGTGKTVEMPGRVWTGGEVWCNKYPSHYGVIGEDRGSWDGSKALGVVEPNLKGLENMITIAEERLVPVCEGCGLDPEAVVINVVAAAREELTEGRMTEVGAHRGTMVLRGAYCRKLVVATGELLWGCATVCKWHAWRKRSTKNSVSKEDEENERCWDCEWYNHCTASEVAFCVSWEVWTGRMSIAEAERWMEMWQKQWRQRTGVVGTRKL